MKFRAATYKRFRRSGLFHVKLAPYIEPLIVRSNLRRTVNEIQSIFEKDSKGVCIGSDGIVSL